MAGKAWHQELVGAVRSRDSPPPVQCRSLAGGMAPPAAKAVLSTSVTLT